MSEDGTGPAAEHRISLEQEAQAEAGMSATALWIQEWAGERHIRRRRDDRRYGLPDAHWAEQWGVYCQERRIRERDAVFQVMDAAKATADRRDQWRYWKYLDEQVQQAAEPYVAPHPQPDATPEPELTCPVEDPNSEWAEVKRIVAARVNPIGYANWVERTLPSRSGQHRASRLGAGRSHTRLVGARVCWLYQRSTRDDWQSQGSVHAPT